MCYSIDDKILTKPSNYPQSDKRHCFTLRPPRHRLLTVRQGLPHADKILQEEGKETEEDKSVQREVGHSSNDQDGQESSKESQDGMEAQE